MTCQSEQDLRKKGSGTFKTKEQKASMHDKQTEITHNRTPSC